jgi:hypothetical protein
MGDRLAFNDGIVVLSIVATLDTAARLRHALAPLSKVVVTSVRFHV